MPSVSDQLSRWSAPLAEGPVRATVRIPGSKSLTNRFLVLAALAEDESRIRRPLVSRDTRLMADALRALGTDIREDDDGWRVTPLDVSTSAATRVDCGLAGTVMRFVPPVAALGRGRVDFDGDPRARERPMGTLLDALRTLGATIDGGPRLPFTVDGRGLRGGHVDIDASASSQFVSGLLLAGPRMDLGLTLRHTGERLPSRPHIDMTIDLLADAGVVVAEPSPNVWELEPALPRGLDVLVEPDLSNAAPFLAAALVSGGQVSIPDWPAHTHQAGDAMRGLAEAFGGRAEVDRRRLLVTGPQELNGVDLDLGDVGELTPVAAALALLAAAGGKASTIRGVAHLRGHETDRLAALATEFGKLGGRVAETEDGLEFSPSPLRGAEFETYADHRMAMAAAVVGLGVDGVSVVDVETTAKTLPDFTTLWTGMLAGSA